MDFHRLTTSFYIDYKDCPEILQKDTRPYLVLLISVDSLLFAIPFRSHIKHKLCFILDSHESGLDFTKTVIITDKKYIDSKPVKIRKEEFYFLSSHKKELETLFTRYVTKYKKEIERTKKKQLPVSEFCLYSCLQYFHRELGLE